MARNSQLLSAVLPAKFALVLLMGCLSLFAETYDGVAAAVGNHAIKLSEINRDIRLTALLNGARLDFSVAAQRKAAERLIDQWMIREEMARRGYPDSSPANAGDVFAKLKAARFRDAAEYQQALSAYGVTEPELKAHVAWQASVLRFIAIRFQSQPFLPWLDQSRKHTSIQYRGGLSQ